MKLYLINDDGGEIAGEWHPFRGIAIKRAKEYAKDDPSVFVEEIDIGKPSKTKIARIANGSGFVEGRIEVWPIFRLTTT